MEGGRKNFHFVLPFLGEENLVCEGKERLPRGTESGAPKELSGGTDMGHLIRVVPLLRQGNEHWRGAVFSWTQWKRPGEKGRPTSNYKVRYIGLVSMRWGKKHCGGKRGCYPSSEGLSIVLGMKEVQLF